MHSKILVVLASLLGASSVVLAAAGSHALHGHLVQQNMLETFGKGVNYAMYGALAILAVAVLQQLLPSVRFFISGYLLALGTLIFSGSLFAYSIAGMKSVTLLTPVGGVLIIVGWLSMAVLVLFQRSQ